MYTIFFSMTSIAAGESGQCAVAVLRSQRPNVRANDHAWPCTREDRCWRWCRRRDSPGVSGVHWALTILRAACELGGVNRKGRGVGLAGEGLDAKYGVSLAVVEQGWADRSSLADPRGRRQRYDALVEAYCVSSCAVGLTSSKYGAKLSQRTAALQPSVRRPRRG